VNVYRRIKKPKLVPVAVQRGTEENKMRRFISARSAHESGSRLAGQYNCSNQILRPKTEKTKKWVVRQKWHPVVSEVFGCVAASGRRKRKKRSNVERMVVHELVQHVLEAAVWVHELSRGADEAVGNVGHGAKPAVPLNPAGLVEPVGQVNSELIDLAWVARDASDFRNNDWEWMGVVHLCKVSLGFAGDSAIVVQPEEVRWSVLDAAKEVCQPCLAGVVAGHGGRDQSDLVLVPQRNHVVVPGGSGICWRDAVHVGLVVKMNDAGVSLSDCVDQVGPVGATKLSWCSHHGLEQSLAVELWRVPGVPVDDGLHQSVSKRNTLDLRSNRRVVGAGVVPQKKSLSHCAFLDVRLIHGESHGGGEHEGSD
jgi:hypothetical protein